MSDERKVHPSPVSESYRREVMEKYDGHDPGPSYGTGLEPLAPLVWRPTPEQIRRIIGDFAYTERTGQNSDWQSYMYCSWPADKRSAFRALMKQIGATHAWIAPVMAYDVGPMRVADIDSRKDPPHFLACLDELFADRIVPIVQVGEGHYYGVKDDVGIDRLIRDLDNWHRWGWAQACDGLPINLWPESNGETTPVQITDVARKVREVLPHSYIGLHVGPDGDGLYQGQGDPGDFGHIDREAFWDLIGPFVDALFWQAKPSALVSDRALVVDILGAIARVSVPMDETEAQARAGRVGLTLTPDELHNIVKNRGLIGPRPVDLVFWEAAQYEFKQSSTEKSRLARLAMAVGAAGSMVGVP